MIIGTHLSSSILATELSQCNGEERATTASSQWGRKSDGSERLWAERGEGKEPAGHLPQQQGGEGAGPVADPDGREEKGRERRRWSQGRGGSTVVGRGGSVHGRATAGASVQQPT